MKLPIRREPHKNDSGKNPESYDKATDADLLVDSFAQELDRWPDFFQPFQNVIRRVMPLADVEETEDSYVVDIELPGVQRDDISVEVSGNHLVVTGERRERQRTGLLRQQTRTTGSFHFEVTLPSDVDVEGVAAALDDGVLNVVVPKTAAARPRKIAISTGGDHAR